MNRLIYITQNDLRIFFSDAGNLFGLIVLPIVFTLVLGWAFGSGDTGPQRVRVDVVDADATDPSTHLLSEVRAANTTLVLCPMDNDPDDFCRLEEESLDLERAIERVQNEVTEALIVIPAGYANALTSLGNAELDFYATGDPTLPNAVEQTVMSVLQKVNTASLTAHVSGALLDELGVQTGTSTLISGVRNQFVQDVYVDAQTRIAQRPAAVRAVTATGEATADPDGFGQSVPGMGSMYVMFTVLGGMAVLWRERTQWTLQRLAALPLTKAQILGGKVLTYFTLGMIQFLIVFGVGLLVGLDFGPRPLLLLPIMVAFVLCCTGIAFAVAPYVTSEDQANGIARLLALSLAPLGGAWWPLEIVPDFMKTISYLSPVSWVMNAFHDVLWYGAGLADVLPELSVLLVVAVALFVVGVRSFRYT